MIPTSAKEDFLAVISHMIGKDLVDIIGYGWLERENGMTKFCLSQFTFDFILDTGPVAFYGGEALTILASLTLAPSYYADYSELGEPCCASLLDTICCQGVSSATIYNIQVYLDGNTDLPEAFLLSARYSESELRYQIFVEVNLDGLYLSSHLAEPKWREWHDKHEGATFTVLTFA